METILVTGGAGFIGSNFIDYIINKFEVKVLNLDLLTYAGNIENTKRFASHHNYKFIHGDICDVVKTELIFKEHNIDFVINFAAESHVDRSILNAVPFVKTNIEGTLNLITLSQKYAVKKYLQVSTDEVYGSLGDTGKFTEQTPISPNSPYSASKAGADLLVRSFVETYQFPAIITRCSNNYGNFQFPEKLIPLMITNAIDNLDLPVYGDGLNIRDWIHVQDHVEALWLVLKRGKVGEVYNIGGERELKNIDIIYMILNKTGKSEKLIKFVQDRKGHDRRYAMDIEKIKSELGWSPKITFEDGINETIEWYKNNSSWVSKIKTGEYLEYYKKQYSV